MSVLGPATSAAPLAQSRYPEDVFEGEHRAVFGSFFDVRRSCWGYACCRQTERGGRCQRGAAHVLALDNGMAAIEGPPRDAAECCDRSEGSCTESEELQLSEAEHGEQSAEDGTREAAARAEAAALRAEQVRAEIDRILSVTVGRHLQVLGLGSGLNSPTADSHTVRRAYRKIALLIHPDKNPGFEGRCKEALVRAQEAREVLEKIPSQSAASDRSKQARNGKRQAKTAAQAASGTSAQPSSGGPAPKQRRRTSMRNPAADKVPADLAEHAEARSREAFLSAEEFVAHVLQHCLYAWQESGFDIASNGDGRATASQAAFRETAAAVMALRQILEEGGLGAEPLRKMERMCTHLLAREYVPANQAYLDLAIGSRTWHADVPSLLESGCSWGGRKAGVERGRLFKQARVAQRLNEERRSSATLLDDEDVKGYVTSMKRLLTVTQALRPHEEPSRNCL